MEKIDRLTPEQEALLPVHRGAWCRIGLNTAPADRGLAEHGIAEAYRLAGFDAPRIVWCSSPLALALARAIASTPSTRLSVAQRRRIAAGIRARIETRDWPVFWSHVEDCARQGGGAGDCIRDLVGTKPRDRARAALWRSVDPQLLESVGARLAGPVRAAVGAGVWAPVGRGVWNSVQASVAANCWAGFRDGVRGAIRQCLYGQHDAHWLGFHDFFRAIGLHEQPDLLRGLSAVAGAAGWWLPHRNLCWVSDRPRLIARDEGGALHTASGPALVYPDGWLLHAWRGTLVPGDWIERPETLTPRAALTHPSVEQRRAACEILGWERVLSELGVRSLQRDEDPGIGELVEADIPEIGRERFLRVTCGTGRRFALPVPPTMTTALEANAWTYGLDAHSYKPEVRT